ncbi:MAG: sigma-70 family RNA polymerase sigma factor [Dehalococcoidia bacterium]|nr:sigma-70 family RNA polymerase sigma factor [Dehalococcoidia bacterium]
MEKPDTTEDALLSQLLASREKFVAYVRRRVPDPDLAEDVVQEGLVRALRSAGELQNSERLAPWFYRVLQNAIADVYRRSAREGRYLVHGEPTDRPMEEADGREICECFRSILPTLKSEYAEILQAMDLAEESAESVTVRLGITPNNLKVRRHRARQALKQRLEETCGTCAKHHCLDCSCGSA